VPVVAAFMRGVEDATVDGFQAVAHVGQRTADDHAHGVIEIGALHLLDDRNRLYAGGAALWPARCLLVGQIGSQSCRESLTAYIGRRAETPMAPTLFQRQFRW